MARILHLIASNSMAGPERQLLHHARNTRGADYEIVLGSFQDGPDTPELLSFASRCGIETVAIPGGVRPGLVDDLAGYLRRYQIDLICTHRNKANVVGHFAAKHAEIPSVPFVHGCVDDDSRLTPYDRLEERVLARSHRAVCTSPAQARELGRIRRGKSSPLLIQNAIVPPRHVEMQRCNAKGQDRIRRTFVFGVMGPLERNRGHRTLIEAFALLVKSLLDQPVELLIMGEGPEEAALQTQARRLAIDGKVCFGGQQQHGASWMSAMDCLVSPGYSENVPGSVLEAMFLRIPVIAGLGGEICDFIQSGETGLLFEPNSASALAEAMKKMVRFPEMRKQLAYSARHHISRNFSPDRQRALLESLYQSVLGNVFSEESENVVA